LFLEMYLNDQIPQAIFNELHYHSQKKVQKKHSAINSGAKNALSR